MISINKLVLDHEEYFKVKLLQATLLLDPNSNAWLKIRSNLLPKYKYTVDLDTFQETLGAGLRVLPSRPALWQKGSSVIDLFVRYDFEHEQDSAVREMLIYGLTERNRVEFYPSLTRPYISHRFASYIYPNILGVIRIRAHGLKEDEIEAFITNWNHIAINVDKQKPSYDGYHSFLESLNE
jgi:hypothetical protein